MGIAKSLQRHLETNDARYEILPHSPTSTASHTAKASRISGENIAKTFSSRTRIPTHSLC